MQRDDDYTLLSPVCLGCSYRNSPECALNKGEQPYECSLREEVLRNSHHPLAIFECFTQNGIVQKT